MSRFRNNLRKRRLVAFLVVPSIVPLLILIWASSHAIDASLTMRLVLIAASLAYGGVCIFGVPAYFVLKARHLTAAWIAAITGFLIGALMWVVFGVALLLSRGEGDKIVGVLSAPDFLAYLLWPSGALGAIVGFLFWLLARPDRKLA